MAEPRCSIFWLLQAITGILIVFHWEIADRTISAIHRPTDLGAIERRIEALVPPGSGGKVTTIWTPAGLADRYTIYLEDKDGESRKVRIAGDGTILKFEDGFGELIGAAPVSLPDNAMTGPPVGFVTAASAALAAIPGSRLTPVAWPKDGDATYRIRVRAPGEICGAYGGSIVLVDANDGSVRGPIRLPRRSLRARS